MLNDKTLVSVDYHLYEKKQNGEYVLLEETQEGKALNFIIGDGMMLPAFEEQIKKLNVGDSYEFEVACQDAYGERNEENVQALPKNIFETEGKFDSERVFVGAIVPLRTADGHVIQAKVLSIEDAEVRIDLNHPLAGFDLKFSGKLIDALELTDEQYDKLHNGSCGCHCGGGHGGDCGCGDCGDCGGGCGDENCHCGGDCCNDN